VAETERPEGTLTNVRPAHVCQTICEVAWKSEPRAGAVDRTKPSSPKKIVMDWLTVANGNRSSLRVLYIPDACNVREKAASVDDQG
jgi:hypothetical protein